MKKQTIDNFSAAKELLKRWYEKKLTKEQSEVLEMIISDSLTYEGYGEYDCFRELFDVKVDESNWKPIYKYILKK